MSGNLIGYAVGAAFQRSRRVHLFLDIFHLNINLSREKERTRVVRRVATASPAKREKANTRFSRFVYKNDLCSLVSASIIALLRDEIGR